MWYDPDMEHRYTKFGLPIIAGGMPGPTWPSWLPKPFWFDWLPVETQNALSGDIETYGKPFVTAIGNLAILALAWEAPAILAWVAMACDLWDQYVGGTPTSYNAPTYTPVPVDPGGYLAWPESLMPVASAEYLQESLESDPRQVRSYAISGVLGCAEILTTRYSRALYGGPDTVFEDVVEEPLVDGELTVESICDGAIIHLSSVPSNYGSISVGGTPILYPRAGWMAFMSAAGTDERQKVEFATACYSPRNLSRTLGLIVKVKPGVEGWVTTWRALLPDIGVEYSPE